MINLDTPDTFIVKEHIGWDRDDGMVTETHIFEANVVSEMSHSTIVYYNTETGEVLMINTESLISARTGDIR